MECVGHRLGCSTEPLHMLIFLSIELWKAFREIFEKTLALYKLGVALYSKPKVSLPKSAKTLEQLNCGILIRVCHGKLHCFVSTSPVGLCSTLTDAGSIREVGSIMEAVAVAFHCVKISAYV